MNVDVTKQVKFRWADGESLPIDQCVCGAKFDAWRETVPHEDNMDDVPQETWECPVCKRHLFWRQTVTVFEVVP